MRQQALQILLTADEKSFCESLTSFLAKEQGYHLDIAACAPDTLHLLEKCQGNYDVILIDDSSLPEPNQLAQPLALILTRKIKTHYPDTEIIIFSENEKLTELAALQAGAYRYLSKPFELKTLDILINRAAEQRRLKNLAPEKSILKQLMRTGPALLEGHNLSEVLDTILSGVQACGFDRVRLYLLSNDTKVMVGRAHVGMDESFIGFEMPVAENIHTRKVLADPRPHLFKSADEQPVPYEKELDKADVKQWACIPLLLHGKVIGKLSVDNKNSQRAITEAELEPVALFASQAAAAIANARLRNQEQTATRRADQRARTLQTIQTFSIAISSMRDVSTILQTACRTVVDLFDIDHSGLVLFDRNYEAGLLVAEYPDYEMAGLEIPLQPDSEIFTARRPVILHTPLTDPELKLVRKVHQALKIRSMLLVPIVVHERVVGTLGLDVVGQAYDFDRDEVELCQVLTAQVAVTLENVQLLEQLQRLRHTTLAITSQLDRKALLTTIIQQAVALIGAKSGGIYEYYPQQDELIVVADHGRPESVSGYTLKVGEGMAGRLVQSNRPFMIISDYNKWPGKARIYQKPRTFGAVLEVPLKWQEQIVGVLYVDDEVGHTFTERDADLLRMFADQAAIALVNSDLIARDADKLRRLETLSRSYNQIMGNLASITLDERLNLIAKNTADILDAEACGIFLVRQPGFLSLEASYGHRKDAFTKGRLYTIKSDMRSGLTGYIAHEGVLFNAYGSSLTHHFAVKSEVSHTPSRQCHSVLAIPLKKIVAGEETLIGLMRADNKKRGNRQAGPSIGFTKEDEWILSLFADAVVVALEGTALVAELSEQKDHWARLVASAPNAVVALDETGHITGFNAQAELILKYPASEILGHPVDILYDDPEEPRQVGKLLRKTATGQISNYETLVRSKSGERIPIRMAATQLLDAAGNRIGSVGYFDDLRRIKVAEQRLALLLKASNTVTQAENLGDSLQSLAEMIVTYLDITFCRSFLLDESRHSLVANAVYPLAASSEGLDWNPAPEEELNLGQWPILAQILHEDQPKLLRLDNEEDRSFLEQRSQGLSLTRNIESLFLIPLKTRNKVFGLLGLADLRPWEQAPFTLQKQDLALAIAEQTVMLIERVNLFDEARRSQQLLRALNEASLHIRAETETIKLLQEVVRLAAELTGCSRGGLYLNHRLLGQRELQVTYPPQPERDEPWLSYLQNLVAHVIKTGDPCLNLDYTRWFKDGADLETIGLYTVAALPLKLTGGGEAVLFVGDDNPTHRLNQADLEILERFAAQASVALQTSELMTKEQRMFRQLTILHKISDYIQATTDLNRILHVVLTGVTANYGLGFNRAALFMLDEQDSSVIGRLGIGHLDAQGAHRDWKSEQAQRLSDLDQYLVELEAGRLPPTPIDEQVRAIKMPLNTENDNIFSQVIRNGQYALVTLEDLSRVPVSFVEAFEPNLPLVVIPLQTQNKTIGLLVADNKFTQTPITPEDIELLITYANTAAIAIEKTRLLQETKVARKRLRSFFKASQSLVSSVDPEQTLQDTVEQAYAAAAATGASLMIIDQMGQPRYLLAAGRQKAFDLRTLLQPSGISMRVMKSGQPIVIEEVNHPVPGATPSIFWDSVAAAVCMPVILDGRGIGVMWLDYDHPHYFAEGELEAIQLYVNQAAIAYDSARRIKELEHLRRAAEAMSKAADLQDVLKQIVRSARTLLEADSTAIWSYDAVRQKFLPDGSVADGIPTDTWDRFRKQEPHRGQTAHAVMEREWIEVRDIDDRQQYRFLGQSTRELLAEIGAKSFQGISLTVGNEYLGVLYINYSRRRSFSEEDWQTTRTFAHHAALALNKARLYDQVVKTRNIAKVVAEVTTLEDLDKVLKLIIEGTQDALRCDAVTLYVYNQQQDRVHYPPKTIGVKHPALVRRYSRIPQDSFVLKMMGRDEIYIADDTTTDPLFKDRRFTRDENVATCVTIPLRVGQGQEKVGVMFVNYRTTHRFTGDELLNIELFASQAAVAIHNAQLYEQVQKRAGILQALYEAGTMVSGSLDLDSILHHIVEQAPKVTRFQGHQIHFACIRMIEEDKLRIVVTYPRTRLATIRATCGDSIDLQVGTDGRRGIMGRAAVTGQSSRVDNVLVDPDYLNCNPETRSELAVPIKLDEVVIGVLNVEHPHMNAFDEVDQRALGALAIQAAIAIQNARLFEKTERHVHLLDAAAQVARGATAILDIDSLLAETVRLIRDRFNVYHAAVFLLDNAGQYAALKATDPQDDTRLLTPGHRLEVGREGIIGHVAQRGQAHLARNVHQDPFYKPNLPQTQAEVAFPLIARGKVIGVLDVQSNRTGDWLDEDIATLQVMADQLANAIQNAHQYEELKETKGLVGGRTALAWMGMANSTWRHSIEGYAINIRNNATMLRRNLKKLSIDETAQKPLQKNLIRIETEAARILDKPITPPLSSEEGLEVVLINDLLKERLEQLWRNDLYQDITYRLRLAKTARAKVRVSPEWIRRAFDLLVENAAQAMAKAPQKILTISTRKVQDQVKINIQDTGIGIAPEVEARLFQERIDSSKTHGGLGMGLLMVQAIIQTYGGDICIDETGLEGTTMVVSLPLMH